MKIYIKDKQDFEKHYILFAEKVFWRDQKDDKGKLTGKVEIKLALPIYSKEVKEDLLTIKD